VSQNVPTTTITPTDRECLFYPHLSSPIAIIKYKYTLQVGAFIDERLIICVRGYFGRNLGVCLPFGRWRGRARVGATWRSGAGRRRAPASAPSSSASTAATRIRPKRPSCSTDWTLLDCTQLDNSTLDFAQLGSGIRARKSIQIDTCPSLRTAF